MPTITDVLELHGEYKYTHRNKQGYTPDSVDIATARYFGKKYKVLFAAVWEDVLYQNRVVEYVEGKITFGQLLHEFEELTEEQYTRVCSAKNIKELEEIVRKYHIFNMND